MAAYGLDASHQHPENGMTLRDMKAAIRAAERLDEVIIFRSTGPWSQRWIELDYPTKNFHVKGKSSDWGPQAGFVPYDGIFSKVGANPSKANAGTRANQHGINDGYADKVQLILTLNEIKLQVNKPEEATRRHAIMSMDPWPSDNQDYALIAERSGDKKKFLFRACRTAKGDYAIFAYHPTLGYNPYVLLNVTPIPLEVMTSSEVGANNRPMTGDYDLMAVCPKWSEYGNRSLTDITKPGIHFQKLGIQPGQIFRANSQMDAVLDMRLNTGFSTKKIPKSTTVKYSNMSAENARIADFLESRMVHQRNEHADMGNITPRILRCINELNFQMGATGKGSAFRRVHHNAESYRNHAFGALTAIDMTAKNDGFPMTAFQPTALRKAGLPTAHYQEVCTLETMAEFRTYATLLHKAGYFVPRNWTWGMSIRDQDHSKIEAFLKSR